MQNLAHLGLDFNEIGGFANIENIVANLFQLPENQGAPPAEQSEIDGLETVPADTIEGDKHCPI
jgi:hypothetical protein